ncbi:LD-carboxypeptidase [Halomonas sp. JS92-SW72]|uniref:LD-carboxypeptidase n=1 Tax=Halomonas sp. JS92-SW72 TaxID=2306583 RepID=UPI000E5AF16D|nr:LD-carboxypeptidase [Halomonas sp. JS92-SW72]AXY42525.1 LD-carboxypeptidase [Halomonas sp. JS92-SW72]
MPLAISLIAPSSFTPEDDIERGVCGLESLGVTVRRSAPLQRRTRYLAGDREWRLAQLHAAYADPDTQAVWAVRGGFGCAQLAAGIDWPRLAGRPKPLIGYSDLTALLHQCHLHGLPAIHGPVVKAAGVLLDGPADERTVVRRQFEETLALIRGSAPLDYPLTAWHDAPSRREGPLVGGNLITLASLAGTPLAFRAPPGALVILEDVGEPYYRLERALWQLVQAGALDKAAAVCLGTFEGCRPYDETPLEAIVAETLAPLGLPLYHGLPVGHGLHNRPWRYGATGVLEAGRLSVAG